MFIVRVALEVQEDKAAEFAAASARDAAEVMRRFPGCLRFGFHPLPNQAHGYLLYEEWESRARFEDYRSSDYFREVGRELFPMLAAPPDSAYFVAERVGP